MTEVGSQISPEGFILSRRGKVRDVFNHDRVDSSELLVVTTDRISVFDVILNSAVPGKGAILRAMSDFMFDLIERELGIRNHLVRTDLAKSLTKGVEDRYPELTGMVSVWRKVEPILIEAIARRHITGTLWGEYKEAAEIGGPIVVYGQVYPRGLKNGSDLGKTYYTPSTKASVGHDENVSGQTCRRLVVEQLGEENAWVDDVISEQTARVLDFAYQYCRERGIIIADTKQEWGVLRHEGKPLELLLIDELLTPDSSRFWAVEDWEQGRLEPFDKQFVRNWVLQTAKDEGHPQGSPGFEDFVAQIELPDEVVEETANRYQQIYDRLCG